MRVDRRFLNWGAFFVALGSVLLLAEGNLVDSAALADLWRLWPLVIVAIGVGILLRRTRWALAGGLLLAVTPGLVLGGTIAAAPDFNCGNEPVSLTTRQGTFQGPAHVDVALSCGDMSISTISGTDWRLDAGNSSNGPVSVEAGPTSLAIRSSDRTGGFHFKFGDRDVWRLALPTANKLDLNAEVNAGSGQIDLPNAQLGTLAITANAGHTRVDLSGATLDRLTVGTSAAATSIRLPSGDDFAGDLRVNAGSLKVCAPADLGLRIAGTANLGSIDHAGLVRNGDAWESPDYATATHHVDLAVTVNVGSFELNPLGGCQ